ncbi:chondroitinase-B domain-containing protein, partial [Flavobacterium sp.]|uniref:Ig-like domain-containing protein n=1 Tax=Flavobacterium sp. TaxID=239 RepID=UPI0038FCA3B7
MNHNQPSKRISSSMSLLSLFTLAMTLLIAVNINASTINVSSVTALQTAINNANAGDVLILANGTYLNNTLSISKSNITVKAATSGGVFLNGTNDITISGNYIVFSGFQFTSGDIGAGTVLRITGSHNVVTQLNFSDYYASKYIQINDGTQYNEITFCNLEKKPAAAAIGCTIQISTSPTVPGYHKIRYCSFQNYYGIGGDNGNEPIRIGLGAERANVSRTIVENCYFNNTGLGDGETVSVKCGENLIRFCTFTNQQNAMLVFRNGDNNVAYGNFFINAGGIRVKEASNIYCYNNYFYNSGIGSTADAVTFTYDNTTYPVVLNNVNFIHNTFVECGNIDLGGTGATNNTWANNIFKKSSGSIFTNANAGTTWAGNIRSGTTGITIATGMTNVDPLLTLNSEGFYGLPSNSPAINAASSSYPSILDLANIDDDPTLISDISGQARVGVKDVGADEYSTATTSNRPLAVTDAGPNYLGGPSIAVSTQPSAASICSGSNTTFTASSTSSLSPTTVQWQRSANSGTTWTNITANIDAATTYSGFTTETLVLTGSSSTINNYQYKAVFTNTIGSVDSNVVALTVITTAVPTGLATKTICGAATVASLTGYTGTALQWYSALTGGSALDTTTALTTGNYYVSQTLNGCESTRKTVAVTVTSPAPTASSLLLCTGSTVSDLTATGTSLKWYAAASGGSQLASSTVLSTTTYYVSQTVSTCESSRTAVSVVIYTPASMPILNADGPGNTYELITSVLAPCQGVAAVEAPDMIDGTVIGTHPAFGRHIAEVMDADLGKYVFEFYSHLAEDNDITGGLDRQRVEIKTYGGSTDNLKGTLGETVTYKWRFKVPTGFQPSNNFTHIHQIKAVDGDDSSPLFTLTPRYGTPNTLQLIYTQDATTSTDTKAEVNLSLFENTWVEAVETIKIGTGTAGTYAITIKKVSDGTTILSYSSNAIQTIRTSATDPATTGKVDNSFIRPKWGIYRSLLDSGKLRDDSMRFSDISISEIIPPTAVLTANTDGTVSVSGIVVIGTTVTVQFPDNTIVSAEAGAGGAYGPITSGVLLSSGNVITTYVLNGNTSPEAIGQFTALPVVSDQTFCISGTVANLTATGNLVKWYAVASGGSVLATSTALASGTYYVTQTVNGLESARKSVLVTINNTNAPVASAQSLCGSATVANLQATGTALKWYTVLTGGTVLLTDSSLTAGTYFVSQTLNSCESSRTSVAVTLTTTAAPTASAQVICNSGTVANLTATGTDLKWYTASTGGSALATSTALTARTYYVSQTLNSCESSRVSSAVTIPVCVLSKQVIAEQPYHDGGFEGQSGVLGTTTQSAINNIWRSSTASNVPTVVGVFNTSAPRSGNTYLTQTLNATTPATNQSGYSRSTFGASATTNVAKWVTFYYKPTPGVTQTSNNLQIKGGYIYTDGAAATTQVYGATVLVPTSTSYTKYSKAVAAPINLGTSNTQLALYLKSVAGGVVSVDVDDIVVYDGTAEDIIAPNAPASANIVNVTASGLVLNWTQPAVITSPTTEASSGVDGGGYVVVRYSSNPNADNDPNVNGIYALGNTITNGTGSLVGTVVYIGTGTTFTDSSLASSTSYYYKVYAVDKAFN